MINRDFKSIIDLVKAFPDEQTCIDHLEQLRWNGNAVSPFDPTSKVYKCKNNRYRCKNTKKYFNVKTANLFDNSKIALRKWFVAIYLVTGHTNGISSVQLSKDLDVTQKTAWYMLQRIRNCFGINEDGDLYNKVEIDENPVGGKNKNRHADKKGPISQGRSSKDKTPVLGMIERGGKLFVKQVKDVKGETLTPEAIKNVKETARVYTDEWLGYKSLERIYDHLVVKHGQGEYVNARVHTNAIEGFWSLLKQMIIGTHHFKKHLQKYVDEMVFRYNSRNGSMHFRFNEMFSNAEHRLKYSQLISRS